MAKTNMIIKWGYNNQLIYFYYIQAQEQLSMYESVLNYTNTDVIWSGFDNYCAELSIDV